MVKIQKSGLVLLPRPHNHRYKITLAGDTITNDSFEVTWVKPVTEETGKFTLIINNNRDDYTNSFSTDDALKVYLDWGETPSTKVFEGFVESIEKVFDNSYGHTLKIKGKHVAGELLGVLVTGKFDDTPAYAVLNQLIADKAPSGFTNTNVENTGACATTITKTFSDAPFWEAVNDICKLCSCDCYVDDDKDFHFFASNSKECVLDIVNYKDNLLDIGGIGLDNADKVNEVRTYGSDENGLPIIATSGSGNRQKVVKEDAISSMAEASELASAEENSAETEKGSTKCLGMTHINPGELIWVSYPPQKIQAQYKVYEVKSKIKMGYFTTELELEIPRRNVSWLLRENIRKGLKTESLDNPNDMGYSFNEEFNDDNGSHTNTEEVDSQLKLQSGQSSGNWVSDVHSASVEPGYVEIRVSGQDLLSSTIAVSVDGGASYESLTENELHAVLGSGSNVKVKFSLVSDTDNPQPLVNSFALLYK